MPVGTVLLLVVAALIYFGVGQRLLDRMRLTDTQALIAIALMIGGSFITLPLRTGRTTVGINLGGGLVPPGPGGLSADSGRYGPGEGALPCGRISDRRGGLWDKPVHRL